MRVSAQCASQRSRYVCAASSDSKRRPRSGVLADARFDFALAIRIADATRQRHHAVVREHVAIERIERGIVDVRREHAFFEIVEDNDAHGAAKPTKRALMQLGPDLRARLPDQQPYRFARVPERQDKKAGASILAGRRVTDHRTIAVIDLAFLACRGGDDDPRIGRGRTTQRLHEPTDTRIARDEAVVIDEVLPNGHRVAATTQRLGDQLAIRLARARTRGASGTRDRVRVGGHWRRKSRT